MKQWLPRGMAVKAEKRIKKMISSGKDWQIYSANQDSFVLAATTPLYEKWIADYLLPEGIFDQSSGETECWIYCSTGEYIVSSLEQGPYPNNNGQIEAFSIAFNTTLKLYPQADLHDAVYIEEYSLILPGDENVAIAKNDAVYGKWLTGGVNISAHSFNRISQLMSWISREQLSKSFELAGFEKQDTPNEEPSIKTEEVAETQLVVDADSGNNGIDTITGEFMLIGRPELEQFLNDNIIDIVLHQEQYKRMGISFPGATILHGPPGCGKTYAVEKLAEYLGWQRFDIDSSTIASSFIHDTSKKISEVFNQAIKAAPSILIIDEMEAFLSNRNMSNSTGTHHIEEVAEFLRKIPEAISKGVLVFAMTNMIDTIDPAILRRGRFDHIIEVKMANKEEIAALLNAKFKELPVAEDVDVDAISAKLDSHPMSDVTFVLREAGRIAVKTGSEFMNNDCFEKALGMLPKKEEKRKIGFNQ
ncbi:MAG: ATP-binding protein [Candidatus Pararuminococcus gallinarum]|jgi:cell division protease FtsH